MFDALHVSWRRKAGGCIHSQHLESRCRNCQMNGSKCLECMRNNIKTRTKFTCSRCSERLPQAHFAKDALNAVLARHSMSELYCVKCAQGSERSRWWKLDAYTCTLFKVEKQSSASAATDLKNSCTRECEACKLPVCIICKQQPEVKTEYRRWSRARKKQQTQTKQ